MMFYLNDYNIYMKKLLLILIVISIALPANAFFWNKKDKKLETELQGKGYAGSLPNLNNRDNE